MLFIDMDVNKVRELLETIADDDSAIKYNEYTDNYECIYCGRSARRKSNVKHDKGGVAGDGTTWPRCIVYTAREMLEQLEQQHQFNNLTLNTWAGANKCKEEVQNENKNN